VQISKEGGSNKWDDKVSTRKQETLVPMPIQMPADALKVEFLHYATKQMKVLMKEKVSFSKTFKSEIKIG
jgi:hypothetical protein